MERKLHPEQKRERGRGEGEEEDQKAMLLWKNLVLAALNSYPYARNWSPMKIISHEKTIIITAEKKEPTLWCCITRHSVLSFFNKVCGNLSIEFVYPQLLMQKQDCKLCTDKEFWSHIWVMSHTSFLNIVFFLNNFFNDSWISQLQTENQFSIQFLVFHLW